MPDAAGASSPPAPPAIRQRQKLDFGRRITRWSIAASAVLALGNIATGLLTGSTSVTAAGFEFAADVLASLLVLAGLAVAGRPPDAGHPYGHGRYESLAGLVVGMILTAGGAGICWRSLQRVGELHAPPPVYAVWPLLGAIVIRSGMFWFKFRAGGALAARRSWPMPGTTPWTPFRRRPRWPRSD